MAKRFRAKYFVVKLLMTMLILLAPLQQAIRVIQCYPVQEDIKGVLSYVSEHRLPSDKIYVYTGAVPAFSFYAAQYGIRKSDYIEGASHRGQLEKYGEEIKKIKNFKRVWVVFSHVHAEKNVSEEAYFLTLLDRVKKKLDYFHTTKTAAYLYSDTTH